MNLIIILRKIVYILLLFTISFFLVACPPKPPCDERIDNPETYENIILSNSVIQQISSELTKRQVSVSPCFVNKKASIGILYEFPPSFSEYQIIYSDYLNLVYSQEDGTVDLAGDIEQPVAFERDAILDHFKQKISRIENDPRVREFITKTEPDSNNPIIPLFGTVYILRNDNRVEYNRYYGLVRGYLLSNDIAWQEFPEIKQAHNIIERNLLIGEYSDCSIGHGEMHSYTSADFHDSPTGPWNLTIALICSDGWNDAYVQINNDGSYEKLEFLGGYY